jgi:hypothetical protein
MSFSHNSLYGNHWEAAAEQLERRIRLRPDVNSEEPAAEFPEAEIGDAERRAAMTRERLRRQGLR